MSETPQAKLRKLLHITGPSKTDKEFLASIGFVQEEDGAFTNGKISPKRDFIRIFIENNTYKVSTYQFYDEGNKPLFTADSLNDLIEKLEPYL